MEGIIKVTPEQLISTAEEFSAVSAQVQNLTQQMIQTVDSLKNAWEGEASMTYTSKFHELEDDMNRMHGMINEHVTDLKDMARQYQDAEKANTEVGSTLSGNVIS